MKEVELSIPIDWRNLKERVLEAQDGNNLVKLKFSVKGRSVEDTAPGFEVIQEVLKHLSSVGHAKGKVKLVGHYVVVVLAPWNTSL